jgi:LAO/AO transport system kinase
MSAVSDDEGVFIRSMATRGALGGLSHATADAGDLLAAAGFEYVLIETAGVGQTELEIAGAADSTVLVLVPEGGDFVQALKAGILEIADLYVVNKADRPGAGAAIDTLRAMLQARGAEASGWRRQVLETVATEGRGVDAVAAEITRHRAHLDARGTLGAARAARLAQRVRALVDATVHARVWTPARLSALEARARELIDGRLTPHGLARAILRDLA